MDEFDFNIAFKNKEKRKVYIQIDGVTIAFLVNKEQLKEMQDVIREAVKK